MVSRCYSAAMKVLGFESSCDETGIALVETTEEGSVSLLSHALYSQVDMHAEYGGVVPELASRDHIRKLVPLLRQVLADAEVTSADIDAVAYTAGPGLIGALFAGASFARSLALAWSVPALPVHHMEGHLLAPLLEDDAPTFPFVALLVSGGHTMLVDVQGLGQYELLGESLDDAVGEAFDKTAKMLQLPYPGGPALEQLASRISKPEIAEHPNPFKFSRPMTDRPGLDFSFSGLKTQVVTHIHKFNQNNHSKNNLEKNNLAKPESASSASALQELDTVSRVQVAAEFQDAVCDTLRIKCERALRQTGREHLVVAGGVGANQALRQQLQAIPNSTVWFPRLEFCTDNGAMIAHAGALRLQCASQQQLADWQTDLTIHATPRWPLVDVSSV